MKVICTRCGGTNIACEAIVNPNTGKIIDYLDESFMHAIRYRLPVYWACALINGDYTGLSDEEEREINNFLEQAEGYPVDVDLETEGFYRCNDANDIAGSCADFIFHKYND